MRGLYRRTRETASDPRSRRSLLSKGSVNENWAASRPHGVNYNNFTMVNPFCQRRHASIHVAPRRLAADRTPWMLVRRLKRGVTGDDVTAGACWRRDLEETIMLRKLSLVAVAAASLGAAALAPTSASA